MSSRSYHGDMMLRTCFANFAWRRDVTEISSVNSDDVDLTPVCALRSIPPSRGHQGLSCAPAVRKWNETSPPEDEDVDTMLTTLWFVEVEELPVKTSNMTALGVLLKVTSFSKYKYP